MNKKDRRRAQTPEHPTDKYARSNQAPPPDQDEALQHLSDRETEDIVEEASEDSFPTSDPPAYTRGSRHHTTEKSDE